MEAKILEQDDFSGFERGAGGLHLWTDTVIQELYRLAEELLQFLSHWLEGEFFDPLSVGPAKVAHQDD